MQHGCTNTAKIPPGPLGADWIEPPTTLPPSRPLNWIVPPAHAAADDAAWPSPSVCAEHGLEKLCETVARVAVRREVLAAACRRLLPLAAACRRLPPLAAAPSQAVL